MNRQRRSLILSVCVALVLTAASCAPAASPKSAPAASPPKAAPTATQAPVMPKPTAPAAKASPTPRPAASAPAPKPAMEQPKSGGILHVGTIANPSDFDVQQEPSINVCMVMAPVYNNIVQYDPETGTKIVPALAASWDVSKDGTIYTFKVRKGVKFHDGTPLTADDIVFNINRVLHPPKGIRSNLGWILTAVNSVEKVGDDTVKLTLDYPFAPLLTVMAHNYFPIYPKHVVEEKGDMKTTAIGTGPFKLASYTPGVNLKLVRNTDYWVKGRPYLDGVTFPIITDRATYLAALRTGRLDVTGKVFGALSSSEVDETKKGSAKVTFYHSSSTISPWAQFNTLQGSPLHDFRVRKAISLAFDRQAALKVLTEGNGLLGGVFSTFKDWGLTQDELLKLPGFAQPKDKDIAEAKKLLADAGYPNGFKTTVLSRTNKPTREASTFLTAQLQTVGIDANVQILQDADFWPKQRKSDFTILVYTPVDTMPDPQWMTRYFLDGSPLVHTGLNDPKIKDLSEKQVREQDPVKRKQELQELERYILEDAIDSLPMVWPYTFIGVTSNVKGFTPAISDYVLNTDEAIWLPNAQ